MVHTHTKVKLALAEHPNHCKHTLTHSLNWPWQHIQVTVHTHSDQTSSNRTFKSTQTHRVHVGSRRTTMPLNTHTHRVQKSVWQNVQITVHSWSLNWLQKKTTVTTL
ncbi:unnamed protein product, partial [Ixodes pacificus]